MDKDEISFLKMKDFRYNNVVCIPNAKKEPEKKNEWPGLEDGSYVYDCLKRYHNTIMNLDDWDKLVRNIWHRKVSAVRPSDWFENPKYKDNVNLCIKEIEDYISAKVGFDVKMRYVKVNKEELFTAAFLCGCSEYDRLTDALYKDYWVIEKN